LIRTLRDQLNRYNIDIAAFCETRLADEGSLLEIGEGYTFFWKGLPTDSRRIHGVGFVIRTTPLNRLTETPVAINERLMTSFLCAFLLLRNAT